MKKITFILLSVFMVGSLMAQQVEGPARTYGNISGQANVLYAQMNPVDTIPVVASQQFTDFSNSVAQIADDFMVPMGKTWDVTAVAAMGGYFNAGDGPADNFTVQIYADNSGVPASTPMFEQTGLSYSETTGRFDIPLTSTIQLNAGHYWISIFAVMDYSQNGQWGWSWNGDAQINDVFADQDPDQVLGGVWPVSWGPSTDYAAWSNRSNYDLSFEIDGTEAAAAVPVSNWAIVLGIFLIAVFMVVRYRRRLA